MEHLHFLRKPQETSHTPLPRVLLHHPAPRVALERWEPLDPLLLGNFRVLHRVYLCKVDRRLKRCLLKVRLGRLVKSQSIQLVKSQSIQLVKSQSIQLVKSQSIQKERELRSLPCSVVLTVHHVPCVTMYFV